MNHGLIIKAIDSREVAGMVSKEHKNLLRDIQGYIADMESGDSPILGSQQLSSKLSRVISLLNPAILTKLGVLYPATASLARAASSLPIS
jgi:phage regulator Rha-like protein